MLLKNIFFILLINQSISYKFLNKYIPFCTNCIHFIEDKTNYPYDPIPGNDKNGKCKLFGTINPVTGNINYEYASICRKDKTNLCGINGKYFTNNTL